MEQGQGWGTQGRSRKEVLAALRPPRLLLLHGPEVEEGQEGLLALPAEEGGG